MMDLRNFISVLFCGVRISAFSEVYGEDDYSAFGEVVVAFEAVAVERKLARVPFPPKNSSQLSLRSIFTPQGVLAVLVISAVNTQGLSVAVMGCMFQSSFRAGVAYRCDWCEFVAEAR